MTTKITKLTNPQILIAEYSHFNNMGDWYQFSTNPQPEEDIRGRAIFDSLTKSNSICYSYLCRTSRLSEKFIEELMFISSNAFALQFYDEKHIGIIVDLIDQNFKKKEDQIDYIFQLIEAEKRRMKKEIEDGKRKVVSVDPFLYHIFTMDSIIQDKLDWFYISKFQKLSGSFIEKHHNMIDEELRRKQTIYSREGKKINE